MSEQGMQTGGQGGSDARLEQAVALHLAGRMGEAQALYRAIVDASPDNFQALHLLGASYLQQGSLDEGIALLERALALKPDYADAHYNYGCALQTLGRTGEAIKCFEAALASDPRHAGALLNLGNALQTQGRHAEAMERYAQLLELRPDDADAHNNWGNSLQELARHEEARDHYETALKLKPDHAEALNNLGLSLHALQLHEEAVARFRAALALAPGFALAHGNLALALLALSRPEEAIAHCKSALAANPNYAEAYNNWGAALHAQNRLEDALVCYEHAIAAQPGYVEAQWNKSLALLALGRYAEGWTLYETRWKRKLTAALADLDLPMWTMGAADVRDRKRSWFQRLLQRESAAAGKARSSAGCNVLVQFEQGLGDALQMLRYVPMLERCGARCWIQAPGALEALVRRSFPRAQVVGPGERPKEVNQRIPMLSLPLSAGTFSEALIPANVPYLVADENKRADWAARLGHKRKLNVALAWRGRATHRNDANRSMRLEALRPLLALCDIQFVSLQPGLTDAEAALLAEFENVIALDRELVSLDETAAVVAAIDMVISVDTSLAHLSGALGQPTWILLPFSADWRWQLSREDSPWYPKARLFRQPASGAWAELVNSIVARLQGQALA